MFSWNKSRWRRSCSWPTLSICVASSCRWSTKCFVQNHRWHPPHVVMPIPLPHLIHGCLMIADAISHDLNSYEIRFQSNKILSTHLFDFNANYKWQFVDVRRWIKKCKSMCWQRRSWKEKKWLCFVSVLIMRRLKSKRTEQTMTNTKFFLTRKP